MFYYCFNILRLPLNILLYFFSLGSGVGPSTSVDTCRVAPYLSMGAMRMPFERVQEQLQLNLSPPCKSPMEPSQGRIPPAPPLPTSLLTHAHPFMFLPAPSPSYALQMATLVGSLMARGPVPMAGLGMTKNSSIAELRLKARQHAAALGLQPFLSPLDHWTLINDLCNKTRSQF